MVRNTNNTHNTHNNEYTQNITRKLQYIQNSILNDTHQKQKAIIALMITEAIVEIKQTEITLDIPYVTETHTEHITTISNMVKNAKATLIASLEELAGELNKRKVNEKRALLIIQKMLESNLYMNGVYYTISKWKSLSRSKIIKQTITVK